MRRRIEHGFGRWGNFVVRQRYLFLAITLLATAALTPGLRNVRIDTHPERFLPPEHPTRASYTAFKRQFGLDDGIIAVLHTDDVFDRDFLSWLRDVHEDLEDRVPHLDEVTSLINVRSTRGEGNELIVEDLLEDWPETEAELDAVESLARANPMYRDLFVSEDGRYTSINILLTPWSSAPLGEDSELAGFGPGTETSIDEAVPEFASQEEATESVRAVLAVLAEHERDSVEVFLAGNPVMNTRLTADMMDNMQRFMLLSVAVIILVLALLFRRLSGVLLPLLVVMLALVGAFGLAGLDGRVLNVTVQVMPTFLLAVCASAAIHVLVIFYQRFDAGETRADAISYALQHSGLAICMAGLTTAGGLASFNASGIEPVQDLGRLAPVGILLGLVYCLVLLPALLATLPLRRRAPRPRERPALISRWLLRGGDMAVSHPVPVVGVTLGICVLAALGAARLEYEHDPMSWFPQDDPIRVSTRTIDAKMGGSGSFEIVVDTGRENGLHEPAFMLALEQLHGSVPRIPLERAGVRKTLSLADILKEIHQALNENRSDHYAIPEDRQLIAQELLLFENSGSDDLEDFVDSRFSKARFTARVPWAPGRYYEEFLANLEDLAQATFPEAKVQVTGMTSLIVVAAERLRRGMMRSYGLALMIITPLMMLLIGSLRGGLASMIPNLAPILCVMGGMGLVGIKLDVFTMLIGSIAIGLAVDDTIHFMHGFYRRFAETGDTRGSVRDTLATTGNALLTTSIVLSTGFIVFAFASMWNLVLFGVLTSLAIALAFLADVIVAPALVTLATRGKKPPGIALQQERLHEAS